MLSSPVSAKALSRGLLDVLIGAGLIAGLVMFCFQIVQPFRNLMLWQWGRNQPPGSRPGIQPQN